MLSEAEGRREARRPWRGVRGEGGREAGGEELGDAFPFEPLCRRCGALSEVCCVAVEPEVSSPLPRATGVSAAVEGAPVELEVCSFVAFLLIVPYRLIRPTLAN